jgi:hypothetical protein
MKRRVSKKLLLNRESLLQLDVVSLRQAAGASRNVATVCPGCSAAPSCVNCTGNHCTAFSCELGTCLNCPTDAVTCQGC